MTTITTTKCPTWCVQHPEAEPETHQSTTWRAYGLSVVIEDVTPDGVSITVDGTDPQQSLDLTPEQAGALAHGLFLALAQIRAEADQ